MRLPAIQRPFTEWFAVCMDHRRVRVHAARIHSGETVMRIDVNPQVFATCLLRVCRVFAACLPRVCCVFAACLLRVCCVFAVPARAIPWCVCWCVLVWCWCVFAVCERASSASPRLCAER